MPVEMLNIQGLRGVDPASPVVMLNLMKFRERSADDNGSGWDAYLRYSALTVPMIKARGGTLLWTGHAKGIALGDVDGEDWDYVALVRYPAVTAFTEMMTSRDYEMLCDPQRVSGCEKHVIICTVEAYSKFQPAGAINERNYGAGSNA